MKLWVQYQRRQAANGQHKKKGRGRAKATLDLIDAIVKIAAVIQPCSVRAIAYQLFSQHLIESMAKKNVNRVSNLCVIAREEGTLPWRWIIDGTRSEAVVPTWGDPREDAKSVQDSYRRNKWDAQPVYVCVKSEKATIEGTIAPVLDRYELPFQVLHGFSGATSVMDAVIGNKKRRQPTLVLYVGDWDPSGLFMSEHDLPTRLARYSSHDPSEKEYTQEQIAIMLRNTGITIKRVALTRVHTEELGEEPSFSVEEKKDDPRYNWFKARYGDGCWELDALDPRTLRDCLERAVLRELDRASWDRYVKVEEEERAAIIETCKAWGSNVRLVQK